jgi:AsmA protein
MGRNGTILVIVAAVLLLLLAITPLLVNAERFRPVIESRLGTALGRPVTIGKLSFSWLAGGISAENISIGEDPAFGTQPFLTARALDVSVEMRPLLLHRELRIESIKVRDPEVRLLELGGKWNVSSLGRKQQPNTGGASAAPLTLRKLAITGGRLVVDKQTYSDVEITAEGFTPDSAFPFTLSAKTPGSGTLKVDGKLGPIGAEFSGVPFDAKLQLERVDLAGSGYFGQNSGIAGTATLQTVLASNGRTVHAEGTATAERLRLVPTGVAMRPSVHTAFTADYDLLRQSAHLSRGQIQIDKSTVLLNGTVDARRIPVAVDLTASTQSFPMPAVQDLLPALGMTLPGGAALQGGTANTSMTITGPVDRLVVSGPLRIADVTLTNFDLGMKLRAVAALAGINTGRDTRIQSLACKLRVAPEGTNASDVNAAIIGLGTLTGGGTMAANNALDLRMTAELTNSGGMLGALLTRTGVGQFKTVPFRISGTTSDPRFLPDVGAIIQPNRQPAAQQQQPQTPLGGLLNQLFRKKQ